MQISKKEEIQEKLFPATFRPSEAANAPVICIPGPVRVRDRWDIAGLKCRDLISVESRQCRGYMYAGF